MITFSPETAVPVRYHLIPEQIVQPIAAVQALRRDDALNQGQANVFILELEHG